MSLETPPASEPVQTPEASPAGSAPDTAEPVDYFADLLQDDDSSETVAEGTTPSPTPGEPSPEATPASTSATTSGADAPGSSPAQVGTQPAAAAPAQLVPAAPPSAAAPQPSPGDSAVTAPQASQTPSEMFAQQVSRLEGEYAIPQELVLDLHAEPEKVLPKLAARIHMRLANDLLQHLHQHMPAMLQQVTERTRAEQSAKTEFYGRWPELQQYEAQVLEVGAMYRKINPTASKADAIERIGQLVCTSLGIPAVPGARAPQVPPARTAAPAFTPAMPGGSGTPQPPSQPNVFTDLANEMLTADDAF